MTTLWIWQHPDWPQFTWQDAQLLPRLRHAQQLRGTLLGRASLQSDDESQTLDTLLANILSSSAIEEERVNAQSVRSSLARRLGVSEEQPYPISDRSEGASVRFAAASQCRWCRDALTDQRFTLKRRRVQDWSISSTRL